MELKNNPYKNIVLSTIPRILSNLDRDVDSPTYGCFDRNYWHYKMSNFASAILQQGCLTLALLHSNNFEGNIYYKKENVKQLAVAAIDFWSKIQLKDGSFNEYWYNEHGFPPTAFSLYAVVESCKILNCRDQNVMESVRKAADFLIKNPEREALNQEIGSMTAVYNAYLLTKAEEKFNRLLKVQKEEEGWFSEYGGADIGYLTVSLNYMALFYKLSEQEEARDSCKKIIDFLQYFVHPDGTTGGEYGTRNTEYFLPAGFEIMSQFYPLASKIVEKLLSNINRDYLNLAISERYILHYVTPSIIMALILYEQRKKEINDLDVELPYEREFSKYFSESQIYIYSNKNYYFISNLSKGGVYKVFAKNNGSYARDCGYRIKQKNKFLVTEVVTADNKIQMADGTIEVEGLFGINKFRVINPSGQFVLILVSTIFGRRIIKIAKNMLIFSNKKSDVKFSRKFIFKDSSIIISDRIFSENIVKDMALVDKLSMRHTASSRFFQLNELDNLVTRQEFNNFRNIEFEREIDLEENKMNISKGNESIENEE
jgi:hypothetical protein